MSNKQAGQRKPSANRNIKKLRTVSMVCGLASSWQQWVMENETKQAAEPSGWAPSWLGQPKPKKTWVPKKPHSQPTEAPQMPEVSQMIEALQIPEVSQTIEASQMPEVSQMIEVPQTTEVSQTIEALQMPEVSQMPEAAQIPVAPQTSEVSQMVESLQIPEVPQTTEVSQTIEALQMPEVSQTAEASQIPDAPQTSEISQMIEPPQMPKAPQPPEAPQMLEVSQMIDAPQTAEVSQTTEASQIPDAPQTSEISQMVESLQIPEAPQTTEVSQTTEASQIPDAPQTSEISQMIEAPQTPKAPKSPEAPQMLEVSQMIEAPQIPDAPHLYVEIEAPKTLTPYEEVQVSAFHIETEEVAETVISGAQENVINIIEPFPEPLKEKNLDVNELLKNKSSPTCSRKCSNMVSALTKSWRQVENDQELRKRGVDREDGGHLEVRERLKVEDAQEFKSKEAEEPNTESEVKIKRPQVSTYKKVVEDANKINALSKKYSAVGNLKSRWQNWAAEHTVNQKLNPFSEYFDHDYSMSLRLQKGQEGYGRPKEGTKTAERARRAEQHIHREIDDMCYVIRTMAERDRDGKTRVTFGELFDRYVRISDKVVGILMRARKHGKVAFEGEMLWQGQDDAVVITLLV